MVRTLSSQLAWEGVEGCRSMDDRTMAGLLLKSNSNNMRTARRGGPRDWVDRAWEPTCQRGIVPAGATICMQ